MYQKKDEKRIQQKRKMQAGASVCIFEFIKIKPFSTFLNLRGLIIFL